MTWLDWTPSRSGTGAPRWIAEAEAIGDVAPMNFALLLLLPASAATDLTPPAAKPSSEATISNAIVATDKTPAANDLSQPAVFVSDGAKSAIVAAQGTRWIA
jgi:hypothetical protein